MNHMIPGNSSNPSPISHLDKPVKIRWQRQFKSWRLYTKVQKGEELNIWGITLLLSLLPFFSCYLFSFLLSTSKAILLSISALCHNREWRTIQRADRQEEIHRQITRQIDQEVVELSVRRITAVTSCDHRRNERQADRTGVTGREREREKTGEEGGRKRRWRRE